MLGTNRPWSSDSEPSYSSSSSSLSFEPSSSRAGPQHAAPSRSVQFRPLRWRGRMTAYDRVECQWCHAQNPPTATSCDHCGAPLDVTNLVSESGWREAPRLRDMTEIAFGQQSGCQVEG